MREILDFLDKLGDSLALIHGSPDYPITLSCCLLMQSQPDKAFVRDSVASSRCQGKTASGSC